MFHGLMAGAPRREDAWAVIERGLRLPGAILMRPTSPLDQEQGARWAGLLVQHALDLILLLFDLADLTSASMLVWQHAANITLAAASPHWTYP